MSRSIEITLAMDAAKRSAVAEVQAIAEAQARVQPVVGPVLGQDSAAGVYKVALQRMGVATGELHPCAMRTVFLVHARNGARQPLAADAAATASYATMFPGVSPVRGVV